MENSGRICAHKFYKCVRSHIVFGYFRFRVFLVSVASAASAVSTVCSCKAPERKKKKQAPWNHENSRIFATDSKSPSISSKLLYIDIRSPANRPIVSYCSARLSDEGVVVVVFCCLQFLRLKLKNCIIIFLFTFLLG